MKKTIQQIDDETRNRLKKLAPDVNINNMSTSDALKKVAHALREKIKKSS